MIDVDKILNALQNDPQTRKTAMTAGAAGAAGLAVGMLSGKSGRKLVGSAAKVGTVAAIGALAYHAWKNREQLSTQAREMAGRAGIDLPGGAAPAEETPPQGSPFLPAPNDPQAEAHARALLRAMIAAAKADGRIDADEKAKIFGRLERMDLSPADKAFVFDELAAPLDIDAVAAAALSPEHAAEIYAASLVAIEDETPEEKAYLAELARKLWLDEVLVDAIHAAAR